MLCLLLSVATLLGSSYCARLRNAPEPSSKMHRISRIYQQAKPSCASSDSSSSSMKELNRKEANTSSTSLNSHPPKGSKGIHRFLHRIKHPHHDFKISSCTCENFPRINNFFIERTGQSPSHPFKKTMQHKSMIRTVASTSSATPKTSHLCLSCHFFLLSYDMGQIDSILKKNNFGDSMLCLSSLQVNHVTHKDHDEYVEGKRPKPVSEYLSKAFKSRDYLPLIMKYHYGKKGKCIGEFEIPESKDAALSSGVKKHLLKEKHIIDDAFSVCNDTSYFETTEDPVDFLKRVFSEKDLRRETVSSIEEQSSDNVAPSCESSDMTDDNNEVLVKKRIGFRARVKNYLKRSSVHGDPGISGSDACVSQPAASATPRPVYHDSPWPAQRSKTIPLKPASLDDLNNPSNFRGRSKSIAVASPSDHPIKRQGPIGLLLTSYEEMQKSEAPVEFDREFKEMNQGFRLKSPDILDAMNSSNSSYLSTGDLNSNETPGSSCMDNTESLREYCNPTFRGLGSSCPDLSFANKLDDSRAWGNHSDGITEESSSEELQKLEDELCEVLGKLSRCEEEEDSSSVPRAAIDPSKVSFIYQTSMNYAKEGNREVKYDTYKHMPRIRVPESPIRKPRDRPNPLELIQEDPAEDDADSDSDNDSVVTYRSKSLMRIGKYSNPLKTILESLDEDKASSDMDSELPMTPWPRRPDVMVDNKLYSLHVVLDSSDEDDIVKDEVLESPGTHSNATSIDSAVHSWKADMDGSKDGDDQVAELRDSPVSNHSSLFYWSMPIWDLTDEEIKKYSSAQSSPVSPMSATSTDSAVYFLKSDQDDADLMAESYKSTKNIDSSLYRAPLENSNGVKRSIGENIHRLRESGFLSDEDDDYM